MEYHWVAFVTVGVIGLFKDRLIWCGPWFNTKEQATQHMNNHGEEICRKDFRFLISIDNMTIEDNLNYELTNNSPDCISICDRM